MDVGNGDLCPGGRGHFEGGGCNVVGCLERLRTCGVDDVEYHSLHTDKGMEEWQN
ncbi:hypothetical protein BJV77DRAFT_985731, partial [Russula vinacea]